MTDELLRDLAKDIPFERPTAARRDAIRSSLLVEAAESTDARPATSPRRWPIVAAFTAGALAAAAIALIVVRPSEPSIERTNLAQVTATSPDVRIDHQIVATDTGSDEIVRIREGTIALAIPAQRRGDRVIVKTTTASVEGDAGDLEVTVANEQLQQVRVKSGTARVIVIGQTPVTLSAGQTWRASVITADLSQTQTRTQTRSTQPPSQAAPLAQTDPPSVAPTATEVSKLAVTDGPTSTTAAPKPAVTDGPSTTAAPKPAVTDRPTSTTAAPAPTAAAKPAVTAAPKLAVTDGPTSTTAAPKPAVTAAPKPAVTAARTPTTAAPKPAVTAAPTPTTAASKPAVTAAPMPTTRAAKRTIAEAPTPTTQAPKSGVTEAPTKPAVTEAPKPASIEQRFKRGWELLRAGNAQQAADELAAAADASPDAPLAADARYFQAVALVRANDPRAAERVLVQFLDTAPKSLRRGRAAVLLGRLLAERGDTKSARAWLETAANDPDPAIAAAAKAGLQALK